MQNIAIWTLSNGRHRSISAHIQSTFGSRSAENKTYFRWRRHQSCAMGIISILFSVTGFHRPEAWAKKPIPGSPRRLVGTDLGWKCHRPMGPFPQVWCGKMKSMKFTWALFKIIIRTLSERWPHGLPIGLAAWVATKNHTALICLITQDGDP